MLHPIFSTAIQRPDLIMGHLAAYGSLFGEEAKAAGSQVVRRMSAWLLTIACGLLFIAMTGIALMLGFLHNQFHWVLVAVPATALLATLIVLIRAIKPLDTEHFPQLKAQLHSDANALRAAS